MNKSKFLALLWVVLVAWTMAWCGNNTNVDNEINNDNNDLIIEDVTESANAVIDYNDSLVDLAYNCIASEDTIWTAYNSEELNVENIQNAISNTVAECNSAINQIESLGNWEWDSSLKDGVITLLQKDIEYYEKLGETVPYLTIPEDELTEEQAELYSDIISEIDVINQELEIANANLVAIQDQFAVDHGYELEDIEWEEVVEDVAEDVAEAE